MRFLALILPVLMPSWRFFRAVDPSPRVEWRLVGGDQWHPFRPRPARVGLAEMLLRLIWNPTWNDSLFVVSCAERIAEAPTPHAIDQIAQRLLQDMGPAPPGAQLVFRLVFVYREGAQLQRDLLFSSDPIPVPP